MVHTQSSGYDFFSFRRRSENNKNASRVNNIFFFHFPVLYLFEKLTAAGIFFRVDLPKRGAFQLQGLLSHDSPPS